MSPLSDELLHANGTDAAGFGAEADFASPPARHFAILTCMDARLDPASEHPLVPKSIPVHGDIDDVKTGRLGGATIGGAAR